MPDLKNSLLILRFTRLGKIPPATYSARLLAECGLPVCILEFDPESTGLSIEHQPILRVRLGLRWTNVLPRILRPPAILLSTLLWLMLQFLKDGRPKLILSHGLYEQTIAALLKTVFRIPFVAHVHEIYDAANVSGFNRLLLRLEGWVFRGAEFTIFPERTRAEIYRSRYRLAHPICIAFNCPPKRLPQRNRKKLIAHLGVEPEAFLVLYMGGLDKRNGVDLFIEALSFLPPRVHAVLAGWVSAEFRPEMERLTRRPGLLGRVHFVGTVDQEKWSWVDSVDASFCYYRALEPRTVHQATASNKIMEAVSAGVPTILNPSMPFRSFLEEYRVGVLATEDSAEGVAKAIQSLMDESQLIDSIRRTSLELHARELNYEHQYSAVLERVSTYFVMPTSSDVPQAV